LSKKLVILSLIVVSAAVAAYFSIGWRSGYEIRKITVTGNQTLSREEILSVARLKDSAMIESDAGIEMIRDRILNHPEIKKAFVSKNPPSELRIEIVEKRPVAILNAGNELLLVDDELESFPF
jgi:cell division protein FtsQ